MKKVLKIYLELQIQKHNILSLRALFVCIENFSFLFTLKLLKRFCIEIAAVVALFMCCILLFSSPFSFIILPYRKLYLLTIFDSYTFFDLQKMVNRFFKSFSFSRYSYPYSSVKQQQLQQIATYQPILNLNTRFVCLQI